MFAKYLEIDSTHRNRTRYPNPAQFTLGVSQAGVKSRLNALDPISDMAPIVTWVPQTIIDELGGTNLVVAASSTGDVFTMSTLEADDVKQTLNYYKGRPITVGALGTVAVDDWRYIGRTAALDYFKVTVVPLLSSPPTAGTVVTFPTVTAIASNRYYLPDNQTGLDSYYVGYFLWNDTKRESATITGHIGVDRVVVLDSVVDTHITAWALTDTYVLRKQIPNLFGVLAAGTNSTSQITLSTAASSEDSFYVNSWVRFSSDSANNATLIRRITAYNGTTRVATIFPLLPVSAAAADEFEILEYTRDNASPIFYNGKWISERKMSIRLVSLILPNNQLVSGANVTSYPKVYVRLRNINNQTSSATIYSNNPHSSTMLFQTTVSSDIVDPNYSLYIKLFGDGMAQNLSFQLNSDIEFGVFLQDGTVYTAIEPDNVGPLRPDEKLQITALFEIV